jgi:hypothetical protein
MIPLVVFMVWIGVHPNTFLEKMEPSVKHLMTAIKGGNGDEGLRIAANRVAGSSLLVHGGVSSETPPATTNQQPATSNTPGASR